MSFLNILQLIDNVVLVSGVIQQSDSVICIHILYILFHTPFHYVFYRILNIVPCAIQ